MMNIYKLKMQDHFAPTSNIDYNTPAVDVWNKQKKNLTNP